MPWTWKPILFSILENWQQKKKRIVIRKLEIKFRFLYSFPLMWHKHKTISIWIIENGESIRFLFLSSKLYSFQNRLKQFCLFVKQFRKLKIIFWRWNHCSWECYMKIIYFSDSSVNWGIAIIINWIIWFYINRKWEKPERSSPWYSINGRKRNKKHFFFIK